MTLRNNGLEDQLTEFIGYIALLLRALHHMSGLQALLFGSAAFLTGIALARVARRLRVHPGRRLWRVATARFGRSDHRHAAIHMHRRARQVPRLR
ncbi:hypothetical protein [Nioella ostreopsis]|uniref:hypothetical protein n=1 Tax=Nioella ostreopsis TaxID=2448479 RepID=UPI000FD7D2CD|nr:hypothetical protein [Nioella ostreopsis]